MTTETTTANSTDNVTFEIPEGFEEVSASEVDGYFSREPGAFVYGVLLRERKFTDQRGEERQTFHMLLTQPSDCVVTRSRDGEWEPATLERGAIIGVDVAPNIRNMARYVGKAYEVFLGVEGKVKIGANRQAWQYKRAVRPISPEQLDGSDEEPPLQEEVPF